MKPTRIIIPLLPALLLAATAPPSAAQADATAAESRVWFTGSSNIRHFTCRAGDVYAALELAPGRDVQALLAGDSVPAAVTLRVPVATLNCGIPLQNRHLRHTLHGDEHPSVEFTLDGYRLVPGDSASRLRMLGRLAVAGVERPVELTGTLVRGPAGAVRLRGAQEIRVTDFGVQPPTRFGGLLRVRDRVTVHFDVVIPQPADVRVP